MILAVSHFDKTDLWKKAHDCKNTLLGGATGPRLQRELRPSFLNGHARMQRASKGLCRIWGIGFMVPRAIGFRTVATINQRV